MIRRLLAFISRVRGGRHVETELADELRDHLAHEIESHQARGLAADEARRLALRDLGGVTQTVEDVRIARAPWGWMRLEQFLRDAAYGVRQIRRTPMSSGLAIATVALGVAGVAAIFSAVSTVLLRPLPYADPDRLVMIWDDLSLEGIPKHFPAPAEMLAWQKQNTVFTDIACTENEDATLSGGTSPEEVPARKATSNLWSVLGVSPTIGRTFTEEEDLHGAKVAVISYGLWTRRFGGSPEVLGQTMAVNDMPYRVIGVMPRDFYFMPSRDIDIWIPPSWTPGRRRNMSWHDAQVVARLKPGTPIERAKSEMAALSLQLTAANDDTRKPHAAIVVPLREELLGKSGTALVVLLAASAALLLIACVNLTNLLLSRGTARAREVAVRTALGAGRGRLIAQFLTESLVLSGLGTAAALVLALPAMRFLETLLPETIRGVQLRIDWRVLVFCAGVAITVGLAFGLVPALRGSRLAPEQALREGGRGHSGKRSHWLQHALIVSETALAVALLTSTGLLLQTFQHLWTTNLGMQSQRLLTFETPLFRYKDLIAQVTFTNSVLEKIRAIPGVVNAGATSGLPLKVHDANATFYMLKGQSPESTATQVALMRVVTRDYLPTLGAQLREGRFFDATDRRSGSPVALVNETFANRHFPGRSALGAQFKYGDLDDTGYWYRIVGVLKEIHEVGMEEDPRPAVYRLQEQSDQTGSAVSSIVVRTSVPPETIVALVQRAVWSIDRNEPISRIQTVEDIMATQLATPSQSTTLLGVFAILALFLASIGLYGVLSYAVTQRTGEIGVRIALGATSSDILRGFGGRGMGLMMAGLVIGSILSAIAARLMTALFYGFQPDYVSAIAVVSMVLIVVAGLACLVPARRAARIDPTIALRQG
jgi:predicted permease